MDSELAVKCHFNKIFGPRVLIFINEVFVAHFVAKILTAIEDPQSFCLQVMDVRFGSLCFWPERLTQSQYWEI